MEIKKDILWRVYLSFLAIVAFGVLIICRAAYIQNVEGEQWRKLARKQHQVEQRISAERGSIFSEDGNILSTSIPFFDIYIDFGAEGLRNKGGKAFRKNLDSLSICLSSLFKDKTARYYKQALQEGYRTQDRYYLIRKNVSFREYQQLRRFPLVREGKNKSGFIAEVKTRRQNPYGLMANRTVGLYREYEDEAGKVRNTNVGLEYTYDSLLRGVKGRRVVKYLASGVYVPVENSTEEPESGKDILTTLDVNIQDIAESALQGMMVENECEYGTCIVMEVKTGKIKAMANLGRRSDGTYYEDLNYAIRTSEPGSTFKLATMLALLEDRKVNLDTKVDLEGGTWKVNGRTVYDSEKHGLNQVSVKEAFEHSSNVGMAKLTMDGYARSPLKYIDHLRRLHLNQSSGIDITGEGNPIIKTPASRSWSATTLPWMSFGYEVQISPIQTLMLYNAVANKGVMLRPYLVNVILQNGNPVRTFNPYILRDPIAGRETIRRVQECLVGVCHEPAGTAYKLFKDSPYKVAGKTGTALMANGRRGYADHIYQSSFAGYFPAEDPLYTCVVVIRNKPFAKKFYGAAVAGPVFKEIADKLYAVHIQQNRSTAGLSLTADSSVYSFSGSMEKFKTLLDAFDWNYKDSSTQANWGNITVAKGDRILKSIPLRKSTMPDVRGMGLADALYLLENLDLKVGAAGSGKVKEQSIAPGSAIGRWQQVRLLLN
jgi:cell division protein FtsI (penicillin-binding protein 3)